MGKIQCFNTPNRVRKVTYQEYIQRGRTVAENEKNFQKEWAKEFGNP